MFPPFTYKNIAGAATTVLSSKPGAFFHGLVVNTPTGSGTITIYDNTAGSGTKIATITLPATLLMEGPDPALYDVNCSTGLTVVTTGAALDITVSFIPG